MQPMRHTETTLVIRELTAKDIPAVSTLAANIWHAHYPGIISHAQIDYMLALNYSPESLHKDLSAPGQYFWLGCEGDAILGFCSVQEQSKGKYFLRKLYVDIAHHGEGVASSLMRQIDKKLAPKELSLLVNRSNIKAINFYIKEGFTIDRLQVTDIGNGFIMDDFVMKRTS